jgi:hypothetical protein
MIYTILKKKFEIYSIQKPPGNHGSRPMIREEVRLVFSEQEERLLSPAETCKLFVPTITKATLTSWTEKGWLQEHRIGGRVFYLKSEVLASTLKLGKYKSVFGTIR